MMSLLLLIFFLFLLTSLITLHLYNEFSLSKRINKAGMLIQELLNRNGLEHIKLQEKFAKSSLFTQIRLLEYALHSLNPLYKDFGTKKTIFERIAKIEQMLRESYFKHEINLA